MTKLIWITAICGIILPGCTKTQSVQTDPKTEASPQKAVLINHGEDDDPPIIMERVLLSDRSPASGVYVKLLNGPVTLTGYTDSNGLCILHLPYYGNWEITLSHEALETITTSVEVTGQLTMRSDTMTQK